MAIPINGTDGRASRLTDRARRAPVADPHTRLSAALGIAAASTGLGLLVALGFDADHQVGDRLFAVAILGGLLGLGYVGTRLRLREAYVEARKAFRLGRMSVLLEQAATRRPSRRSGHTHAEPWRPAPMPRTGAASAASPTRSAP